MSQDQYSPNSFLKENKVKPSFAFFTPERTSPPSRFDASRDFPEHLGLADNIDRRLSLAEESNDPAVSSVPLVNIAARLSKRSPKPNSRKKEMGRLKPDEKTLHDDHILRGVGGPKKQITFRHPSGARRNVDKLILRAFLRAYDTCDRTILKDPIWTGLASSERAYYWELLASMKQAERSRGSNGTSKKYARLIESILQHRPLCLLLRKCMILKRDQLLANPPASMSPSNRRVYIDTLQDYLEGIASLSILVRPFGRANSPYISILILAVYCLDVIINEW